jgi:hypothetical protein
VLYVVVVYALGCCQMLCTTGVSLVPSRDPSTSWFVLCMNTFLVALYVCCVLYSILFNCVSLYVMYASEITAKLSTQIKVAFNYLAKCRSEVQAKIGQVKLTRIKNASRTKYNYTHSKAYHNIARVCWCSPCLARRRGLSGDSTSQICAAESSDSC